VILTRIAYLPNLTLGWLTLGGLRLATIERPWIPAENHRGGMSRISCVPDGTYKLRNHSGPRFKDVWALVNPDLDVHHMPAAGPGRSAILIHAGNTVYDVVGCIAVGRSFGGQGGVPTVLQSQAALAELRQRLGDRLPHLEIRACRGTSEMNRGGLVVA
jgi:hypothetical protein